MHRESTISGNRAQLIESELANVCVIILYIFLIGPSILVLETTRESIYYLVDYIITKLEMTANHRIVFTHVQI